jgi:hypothetical protein
MQGLLALLTVFLVVFSSLIVAAPRIEFFSADRLAQSPRDSVKIWVFFRDKGASGAEAIAPRAAVRVAQKGNLAVFIEAEKPVSPEYLSQIERLGARVWQTSRWLNAASIWVAPERLAAIEQLPFVAGFRPVARFVRKPDPERAESAIELAPLQPVEAVYADSYGPTITQLDSLNIPMIHTLGRRGDSVLVAMLDDGYRKSHTVFSALYTNGQVLAEYDFIQKDFDTAPDAGELAVGQGFHGTETWSAVGGTVPGSYLGGAFKAHFILAKTEHIPAENQVEEDNWVAALEWADSIGADVISSSLAYLDFDDSCVCDYTFADLDGMTTIVSSAATMAADLGILVCNAAGNNGPGDNTIWAPADAFDILACGAVDSLGVLTSFSSKGPTADGRIKPELVAQGSRVYLASPTNLSGYTRANGTSFSTPLMAAASAVLMSVHPDWAPRQIREALMLSASNAVAPNSQRGWGVPDLYKAALFRPDSTVTFEVVSEGSVANIPVGSSSYQVKVVVHNPRDFPVSSPQVHYREISNSVFSSVALVPATGDTLTASIPIASSNLEIVYYASANGSVVKDPVFAPVWLHHLILRPWFKDHADSGSHEWQASGANLTWGPSGRQSNSGFFSFADSPRGNYRNNVDERWEMKRGISLDPKTGYFLQYFERYTLGSGDSVWLEVSTDGGANWTPLPGTRRFADTLSTWTEKIISLGAYDQSSDFRIRLRLKSNASAPADGWFVDNISLLPRGDMNGDGLLTPTDAVQGLAFIFLATPIPVPSAAGDMNGDLSITPGDAICLLNSIFLGSACATP